MPRYLLLLIALLPVATVAHAAESRTPRGIAMAYECKQIDPKVTGFSCEFDQGELTIRLREEPAKMSPDRRELSDYEFTKIALRYFELGGKGFQIQSDFWPKNKRRLCSHVKNKPYYEYGCSSYTVPE